MARHNIGEYLKAHPEIEEKRKRNQAAALAAKYGVSKNGAVPSVATAIAALTPEQIVGAIQARIDDLNTENARLYEELVECRTHKQALDKEVADLRRENRELASEVRAVKEQRSGLRLFGTR